MQRPVVGVLRGGPSSEYEVSLLSGANVLRELDQTKYEPRDLFVSLDGTWHAHGREASIAKALQGVDVVFNAMHGEYGEDGTVQRILDMFGVPYTGSESVPSAVAFNKHQTKEILKDSGIRMPAGFIIDLFEDAHVLEEANTIVRQFPSPWVVKPMAAGSSVGVAVARDGQELVNALQAARSVGPSVLIEEYIRGKEATCGVSEGFRGHDMYAFMPIEIILPEGALSWTFEAKYDGSTRELCPGNFSEEERRDITGISQKVHKLLGLRHYSRSDFILTPGGVYFLEVNTLPGLTSESLLPKAVKAGGSKLSDFFDHLIQLALKKQ